MNTLRKQMEQQLSKKRFAHTLSVEQECIFLSDFYLPDKEQQKKLRIAAILHDITKEYSLEDHYRLCTEKNVSLSQEDWDSPAILHARTGSLPAQIQFHAYVDDAVCSAIYYHSTGKEDMTLLEKLLYLADYTEETRTFSGCVKLRHFVHDGIADLSKKGQKDDVALGRLLEEALLQSFSMTLEGLLRKKEPIHSDTVKARNFLLQMEKKNESK